MKSSRYSLPLLICFCVLVGCKNTSDEKSETLHESISLLTSNPNLADRIVLAIPLDGCSTCITKSINFLKNNYNRNCEFVISDRSFKKIKFKIGKLIYHKNVIIDTALVFKLKQVIYNSPEIFYCSNGKISKNVVLMPQNIDDELMKLQDKIANNR